MNKITSYVKVIEEICQLSQQQKMPQKNHFILFTRKTWQTDLFPFSFVKCNNHINSLISLTNARISLLMYNRIPVYAVWQSKKTNKLQNLYKLDYLFTTLYSAKRYAVLRWCLLSIRFNWDFNRMQLNETTLQHVVRQGRHYISRHN